MNSSFKRWNDNFAVSVVLFFTVNIYFRSYIGGYVDYDFLTDPVVFRNLNINFRYSFVFNIDC